MIRMIRMMIMTAAGISDSARLHDSLHDRLHAGRQAAGPALPGCQGPARACGPGPAALSLRRRRRRLRPHCRTAALRLRIHCSCRINTPGLAIVDYTCIQVYVCTYTWHYTYTSWL